jgi:hypothetical protein
VAPSDIADCADSIKAELRRRRTQLVRHGTQSLEEHLFNTFHILTAWHQPPRVQYAGLIHSVYSTDAFTHQTFKVTEREQVRALVGTEAERLAHLFCTIDRRELMSKVAASAGAAPDALDLTSRLDGQPMQITRVDAGDLLAIYMANGAEQTCGRDRSPGTWLSSVSQLGRRAARLAEITPPVFDNCTTVVSRAEETALVDDYRHPFADFGNRDWPLVAEPLVWMGFRGMVQGTVERAGELGRAATARLQLWGTPWDKRLNLRQWLQLCAALCDAAKADEIAFVVRRITGAARAPSPERFYLELTRTGLLPPEGGGSTAVASAGSAPRPLPARFERYLAGLRTNHDKPRMPTYPGLRRTPWHDPRQFRLASDLEEIADTVAAEVHALAGNGFQEEAENINRSGQWNVLFLYERGRKNERNCSLCPQTAAVIEANRTVLSLGGLAYFSMLEPGTHISPHTGPTNMRLRCHLGIDVPERCGLRVGGVERSWEEGRCLVFDDSFTHEAWNDSARPRIVLVVDLWHPDLTDDEVALLKGLHRYATATGTGLIRYWNRNRIQTS